MNDQLRRAMSNVDLEEIEAIAQSIGAEAEQTALAVRPQAPSGEAEAQEKQKQHVPTSASAIRTRRWQMR